MPNFYPYQPSQSFLGVQKLTQDLTSTDDKIIMHLGQAPYGVSGEEQSAYSNGLQQIILDLRQRKVKDFETVAKEIAAYRQKFLLGNSKAVLL